MNVNGIVDPIEQGLKQGWDVIDGSKLTEDQHFAADIVIIGSGAGGGISAEELAKAGFKVIILEMGGLRSSKDFDMEERNAYPQLYQESSARKTKDKAITILQGRTVGGSTTVNWTTSIRTPEPTQQYWRDNFGVKLDGKDSLVPYFAKAEQRLNIHPWPVPPNANNQALLDGCKTLGWSSTTIKRNVKGCANLGYCGMGCPINAKQSMLVTTIPGALNLKAKLISNLHVEKLNWANDQVVGVEALTLDQDFQRRNSVKVTLTAKHYILSAGAMGSPAILLRSKAPDPSGRLGKFTYLHPVVISGAIMPEPVNGHSGAPQSIYSDEFLFGRREEQGVSGPMGYKLEVPPIHPILIGSKMLGYGEAHGALMKQFNHFQVMLALMRDGFHQDSVGGSVELSDAGDPILDYPISDYLWDGMRQAHLNMVKLQFAAGATSVFPIHKQAIQYTSLEQATDAINQLSYENYWTSVVSAHVMGGCNMGEDVTKSVVNSFGAHHQLQNLSVFDGSVFPTSLGANPQLSIYGLTYRNVERLIQKMRILA
ncbi:MAG: choline dehydrogenase-like flavoprotein [Phenylobacterium sp.]|jgi:choline dehydrogenase-like flavoprotein